MKCGRRAAEWRKCNVWWDFQLTVTGPDPH